MTEAEELVRGLARKWALRDNHPLREPPEAIEHDTKVHFERMRDSGLVRLIEAGQSMRNSCPLDILSIPWDAAKAEMKERVKP